MTDYIILRTVIRLLVPCIIVFGLYVQFHGEYGPGGGFQAGVIVAAAFIVHGLIYELEAVKKILPSMLLRCISSAGVLLYAGVGITSMLKGGEFLNYSVLLADSVSGQKTGIILIEAGVGLTVFSVIMLIFYCFGERGNNDS